MLYKYTFRFNAKHNTSLTQNLSHIHTFEVTCIVKQNKADYVLVENQIKEYLLKYMGQDLNLIMQDVPSIEYMAELFFYDINNLAKEFEIIRLELSDKPIQTYIIEKQKKGI